MTDAPIKKAKQLKGYLDLGDTSARTCADAADMLQVLGTEVDRLRQAIGCYLYGRIDRHELRKISESWNS